MNAKMRSTQRSDARNNRLRILATARSAFAEEGLDVTIREIARRADVGVATVYRHFPTKENLLDHAFTDQLSSCQEIVERGLADADPWQGFALVIQQLMAIHALNRGFARAFTSDLPHAAQFTEARSRSLQGMRKLVRRAQRAGVLRTDFTLADVNLALMANEGIRGESPARRAAASCRLAVLITQSFRAPTWPPSK